MYQVFIERSAQKELKKIPPKEQRRIAEAIEYLAEEPFAGKKLQGTYKNRYSLRIWPYRIIYTVVKSKITVFILAIGHRQGVYNK